MEIMEFLWNLPVNAEYAIEMDDCFYNSECTQAAAMGGHLEVLKWLRSKDSLWMKRQSLLQLRVVTWM